MSTIRPRRVSFDLSLTPLHWVPGDPQTTHTINVLHLLLPAGERWFLRVFAEALPLINDPALSRAMRGFMGQEGSHARAHDLAIEHLEQQGVDIRLFTRRVDWLFERMLARRPFGIELPAPLRRPWLLHRLGLISAIEHFTTFLGDWVLDARALDDAGADPAMMALLRWHGAEEVEHRSVAFDVATYLGATWAHRALAMAEVAPLIIGIWVRGTCFLMRADTSAPAPSWQNFHRAGKREILPTKQAILSEIPRYLRRGYHPSQTGSLERALAHLNAQPPKPSPHAAA